MTARLKLHPPEGFRIAVRGRHLDIVPLADDNKASPGGGGKQEPTHSRPGSPAAEPRRDKDEKQDDIPDYEPLVIGTFLRQEPGPELGSIDEVLREAVAAAGRRGWGQTTFRAQVRMAEPIEPDQLRARLSGLPDDLNIIVQLQKPSGKE
jgi:hypothetical protein